MAWLGDFPCCGGKFHILVHAFRFARNFSFRAYFFRLLLSSRSFKSTIENFSSCFGSNPANKGVSCILSCRWENRAKHLSIFLKYLSIGCKLSIGRNANCQWAEKYGLFPIPVPLIFAKACAKASADFIFSIQPLIYIISFHKFSSRCFLFFASQEFSKPSFYLQS